MSWRSRMNEIYESTPQEPGARGGLEFFPPTSAANIAIAEAALQARFPDALRSLLLESDGVMDRGASMWLIWTLERIIEDNRSLRAKELQSLYERDFRSLVFFADAGADGILFGFPVVAGTCAPCVMVWHPIDDDLDPVATSLEEFVDRWLTDGIAV